MSIAGRDVPALRLALACLGSLTPLITYWAGRAFLGRAEAVVAGLALALYGPLVFTAAQLEKTGLGALFAALALVCTGYDCEPRRRAVLAVLTRALWGGAVLLRANVRLIAPIGALWWLACPGFSVKGRAVRAGGLLLGIAGAIAPVTIVDVAASRPHEFILTTWQGGAMCFTGNGPGVSVVVEPAFVRRDPHVEASDFAAEAKRRRGRRLTRGDVSSFWYREGLRRWREAPLDSLRLVAFKL